MDSDTHTSQRMEKGALLVGFVSLAVAVTLARGSPPEAYELSIYAGTPLPFWVGSAVALTVAVFVGLGARGGVRRLALVLGGTTTLAVASLPVVRSYHFFGPGDSLTHLGWTRDIATGELSVLEFLYPGTHTVAVFLADVTGMALTRALLVMVMAFTAVFVLFVPLATWAITRDRRATAIAAFSGFLLLPINNVSVYQMAHPTSQAITFLPLVLYLLARYATRADRDTLPVGTPTGALLALASVAILLVHPQQAANVLVVFVAVLALQLLARWAGVFDTDHRTVTFQTVFVAVAFLVWAPRHDRASGASTALVEMLTSSTEVAGSVGQRAVSLSAIGGSFELLFAKLFLVSLVFSVLTALVVLSGLRSRFEDPDTNAFARYFGLGLVPLLGLFAAFMVASYGKLHFRQLGFVMVLATVLGALALSQVAETLSTRFSPTTARAVVGVAFVLMLALSVPTVYNSPYMYQGSDHVTQAEMTGYGTAFEHTEGAPLFGVRGSGGRFADGILGFEASRERDPSAGSLYANTNATDGPGTDGEFSGSYLAENLDGTYLAFSDRTPQQEAAVYRELRFSERGFRSLDSTPGIDRVQANTDFQTYRINGTR
ncbi:hypothetical protein NGM10_15420 [Halorussus salilacus]|uniref:hypothetical protein n=1 Tax=Halorussus salilacus TaxID=2953750 RepID=UPI00209F77B2|nr:hypothetical protein [Halorussus salilacus]USZ68107.1 hypothetical protein NGM10_15420 [Halorussus salilacus]